MIETKILTALQTAVLAARTASTIPAMPVKVIGRSFDTPSNGKWLEIVHIPNNNGNEFWSDGKTYAGILRLLLHWPIDDAGAYPATGYMESVAGYFTKGRQFTMAGESAPVQIVDEPNFLGVMEMPPELLLPLSIRYQCFKA